MDKFDCPFHQVYGPGSNWNVIKEQEAFEKMLRELPDKIKGERTAELEAERDGLRETLSEGVRLVTELTKRIAELEAILSATVTQDNARIAELEAENERLCAQLDNWRRVAADRNACKDGTKKPVSVPLQK